MSVANEKVKLRATYLNGIALAIFAIGCFAPLVSAVTGVVDAPMPVVLALVIIFGLSSAYTHYAAIRTLEDLSDE